MKLFRKVLFWSHLVVGLSAVIVVVIMSATGVALTYQKQMTAWADRRAVNSRPPTPDAVRLGADELLARASTQANAKATSLTIRSRVDAPTEIAFGRDRRELVNAYTGQLLGEGSKGIRAFFRWVTAWHRTLGATGENRALGRQLTGAANLGFLFLVVSGFYLWWPRNWTMSAFRSVLMFRRRLSAKARDFNWHNVIGFWSAVPLFFVVLSGVVISYKWAGDLVYRSVGEQPPVAAPPTSAPATPAPTSAAATSPTASATSPATSSANAASSNSAPPAVSGMTLSMSAGNATPSVASTANSAVHSHGAPSDAQVAAPATASMADMIARAQQREPKWTIISATLPNEKAKTVTFSLDRGTGGQPQLRSQLVLDRATGEEVRFEPFASQTKGRRLRSILRFAHTGEVLGIPGQTLAGLVSLGAVILGYTGLMLSVRRLRGWAKRRAGAPGNADPVDESTEVVAMPRFEGATSA